MIKYFFKFKVEILLRTIFVLVVFLIIPLNKTIAEEEASASLREDLVKKLYQQSVEQSLQETNNTFSNWKIAPETGLFYPIKFVLSNNYFRTNYADNITAIPFLNILISGQLWKTNSYVGDLQTSIGYAYKSGNYTSRSSSGYTVEDTITLRWIPLTTLLKSSFNIPKINFFYPSVAAGLGVNLIEQTGTLDGMNQVFWIPSAEIGASVTFFDNRMFKSKDKESSSSFGGVDISMFYSKSFLSEQVVDGLIYKIGLKVNL